jgi:tRNA-2-methylthio-N6-dimethylallyladenosine synthase
VSKKLYIKTYGCQMNVYDTVRMHDVMAPLGYSPADSYEDADMVILNTCHIREKADEKVYSDLGRIRKEKDRKTASGEKMLVAVGGCVGQAEGPEIIKRAPYVDMVFGPQSYHQLPEMVTKAIRDNGGVVELDFAPVDKFDKLPEVSNSQGVSAFLSVQEGCDKFCSFCVVPYTRGVEYSRPFATVMTEAKKLVDGGAKEIMLLGQNVNAYHGIALPFSSYTSSDVSSCATTHTSPNLPSVEKKLKYSTGDTASLADLIDALAQINGLERIRYTTSHPRDMSDDLIAIHGSEAKLMPYLHLPIQSGSDEILKKMNRKHKAELYIDIIDRLRKVRPDIAMSSDFIVGFPGETDENFEDTMNLIRKVRYASVYSFKYSQRPGTPAAVDENQVPELVKQERLARLQALVHEQQTAFNQASVGKTLKVLFDRDGKHDGQLLGKSEYMQSVYVKEAPGLRGNIVDVKITAGFLNSVTGEVVTQSCEVQGCSGACAA